MQASSQDQPLPVQDASCSPESEVTVATEDLPHTADWIALRQKQASQLQSLAVSSSFDSQDTVLTEDLPDTNDWLKLRKYRGTRISHATAICPTATLAHEKEARESMHEEIGPSITKLAPVKVTPAAQNEFPKAKPRDPTEPASDSEATTWSFDENYVHPTTDTSSIKKNINSPMREHLDSDPVSPLTQHNNSSQIQSHWIQSSQRRTITETAEIANTVSSPLLFPRKRRQLPQSPANSIVSNPLFLTRNRTTKRPPPSTILASKQEDKNDSDATTPSPPQKQQPWFKKSTKKRKLQQIRLTFG